MSHLIFRILRGLRRRISFLHPKSWIFDYNSWAKSTKPMIARIIGGCFVRIWPGDVLGRPLYVHGIIEPDETAFVIKYLRSGMVFFDIGANLGYYSLIASKLVGPAGQVHSFEPGPRIFREFEYNLSLNNTGNVYANRLALGNSPGLGHLSRYPAGKEVYGSLSTNIFYGTKVVGYDPVEVTTLDDYFDKNKLARIDFLKIDVEGGELPVMCGGSRTIKKFMPTLLFEIVEGNQAGFGYSSKSVLDFLYNLGYTVYTWSCGRLTPVSPKNISEGNNFTALRNT